MDYRPKVVIIDHGSSKKSEDGSREVISDTLSGTLISMSKFMFQNTFSKRHSNIANKNDVLYF